MIMITNINFVKTKHGRNIIIKKYLFNIFDYFLTMDVMSHYATNKIVSFFD